MDRVKLSDFKMVTKYRIVDKMFTTVDEKNIDNKDIEFYNFTMDDLKELENVNEMGVEEFFFTLIKKATNVEIDIDIDEFKIMCNKSASLTFKRFMDKLLAWYVKLVKDAVEGASVENNINNTIKEFKEILPQVPVEKTKEEKLKDIEQEIESCNDLNRYKELIKLKEELEKEVVTIE